MSVLMTWTEMSQKCQFGEANTSSIKHSKGELNIRCLGKAKSNWKDYLIVG